MKSIIKFLKNNDQVSIRQIELGLYLPKKSISLAKEYIPSKYITPIKEYLMTNYNYNENTAAVIENKDNQTDIKPSTLKIYNIGRIPHFNDSLLRYQDKQGLWRRADLWCMETVGKVRQLKEIWQSQTGEVLSDGIGEYSMSNNGNKMYFSYK